MNSFDKVKSIVKLIDDKKGENIVILDLRRITTISDYFVIATGTSTIHINTIAREIRSQLKKSDKIIPINPINQGDNSWVILDYQDCIVHLFLKQTREYYNLEDLWFEAKRVKFDI